MVYTCILVSALQPPHHARIRLLDPRRPGSSRCPLYLPVQRKNGHRPGPGNGPSALLQHQKDRPVHMPCSTHTSCRHPLPTFVLSRLFHRTQYARLLVPRALGRLHLSCELLPRCHRLCVARPMVDACRLGCLLRLRRHDVADGRGGVLFRCRGRATRRLEKGEQRSLLAAGRGARCCWGRLCSRLQLRMRLLAADSCPRLDGPLRACVRIACMRNTTRCLCTRDTYQ